MQALAAIRARGALRCTMAAQGLVSLQEAGGYRLKFPHNEEVPEAVIVNTAGGLVGGDALDVAFSVAPQARLMISTTGAEKIYDAKGLPTTLSIALSLADDAALYWLPQETILYNGADFKRRFEVHLAKSARLVLAEMLIFGRGGAGEIIHEASIRDHWRVYREEKLIFADSIAFKGALQEKLMQPAIGNGAKAMASIIVQNAAHKDAQAVVIETPEQTLLRLRAAYEAIAPQHPATEYAFTVRAGLTIARFLSSDPYDLRLAFSQILETITPYSLPRNW